MQDHLLADFNMEDEYSYCLSLGKYRTGSHLSSEGSVMSWVSTDALSSRLCTRQRVKSVQSYITVDYLLPSWILVMRDLHCTGRSQYLFFTTQGFSLANLHSIQSENQLLIIKTGGKKRYTWNDISATLTE